MAPQTQPGRMIYCIVRVSGITSTLPHLFTANVPASGCILRCITLIKLTRRNSPTWLIDESFEILALTLKKTFSCAAAARPRRPIPSNVCISIQGPYVQQPHAHDAPSPAMSVFLHKGPMCSSRTPTTPHPQPHPATATATTAATATGCDSQPQPATATAKATWSSGGQLPSNASNCPGTTRNVRLEYAEMSRVKLKYSRRGRHSDIILRTPSGNYKWGGGPEA